MVGAPYHRNNAGNLAVYRFFLGDPARGAVIARAWDVRYVATCGDTFADAPAGSLASALRAGHAPSWLRPIAALDTGLRVYVVEPDLFPEPPTR